MKNSPVEILVPGALAAIGIVLLVLWSGMEIAGPLQARVPGLDRPPNGASAEATEPPVPGMPIRSDGQPSELSGRWPCFRGERLDAVCHDSVPLARQWPEGGPKAIWSVPLGEGHAGAAVADGCVYLLDYDHEALADTMRCLSLDDGREIWRNSYPVTIKRYHGISRTVAAIVGDQVISLGPKCQVVCWDTKTGQARWLLDLVLDCGAKVPQWYAGQCPLVDNDRLILAPGGDALLVAVDYRSGQVIWKSPNPRGWSMTHSSIVPMELAGKRMYVYCGSGGVAGIAADDGSLLWDTTDWKIAIATVPTPVVLPEDRIFFSGGYNAGALFLEVREEDGRFVAQTIRRLSPKEFDSIQQTPILFDGHLYGVRGSDEQLVCLDLEGNEIWSSGSQHRFGNGPYIIADGLIFVMNDTGRLALAEATPEGYRQLAEAQVLDGHDSWGPMALASGRLIVRDLSRMVCLDVAAEQSE
jgi:outer membrane protein assembly factor BamB